MEPALYLLFMIVVVAITAFAHSAHRSSARESLRTFARRLEGGQFHAPDSWFSGVDGYWVRGQRSGRRLRFQIDVRGSGKQKVTYGLFEVGVPNAVGHFDLEPRGLLSRFGRWLGGDSGRDDFEDDFALRTSTRMERHFQERELRRAIRHLFETHHATRLRLRGSTLHAERRINSTFMSASPYDTFFTALERIAKLCERRRLKVEVSPRVKVRESFGWTGGGDEVLCPYCRTGADPAAPGAATCESCGTLHHAECFAELGRCTIFGCGGRRAAPVGA